MSDLNRPLRNTTASWSGWSAKSIASQWSRRPYLTWLRSLVASKTQRPMHCHGEDKVQVSLVTTKMLTRVRYSRNSRTRNGQRAFLEPSLWNQTTIREKSRLRPLLPRAKVVCTVISTRDNIIASETHPLRSLIRRVLRRGKGIALLSRLSVCERALPKKSQMLSCEHLLSLILTNWKPPMKKKMVECGNSQTRKTLISYKRKRARLARKN